MKPQVDLKASKQKAEEELPRPDDSIFLSSQLSVVGGGSPCPPLGVPTEGQPYRLKRYLFLEKNNDAVLSYASIQGFG
jgi:hypothetical protein